MALMRTGRKMMMGDPPDKTRDVGPMKVLSAEQSARNLMPVKISGSKDDIYGTYASRGDIEDAKYKNRVATETYNKASSEYKQKSEAKSSYDKQKSAYDDYVKSKPTRKAKGTLDDMTEQQEMSVYGKKELSGSELESFYNVPSNKSLKQSSLPNERVLVHDYEGQKKTGFKGSMNVTRMYNDPGADPGDPGQAPKSPELVKPKTTTLKKPKIEEAESWNAPTRAKGGGSVFKGEKVPVKKTNEKRQKGYTYGKERKMATAYYGTIGSTLGEDGRYATSGELGDFQKTRKEEIKGLKTQRAEAKGRVAKREITEDIKSSRKDIREAKLGKKYVESLPNRYQSIAGVDKNDIRRNTANEKEVVGENKPKRVIRDFTPEAMKGSTEQERQSMLKEKKKVKNLGRKEIIRPRNR
jgi:hypothetical protein